MFVKAICFKDVRPGDVVCGKERKPEEITNTRADNELTWPRIVLYAAGGVVLSGEPDQIIGLVHRPWPEGKTESDIVAGVWEQVAVLSRLLRGAATDEERDAALKSLHEAIEAYELGKPPEEEPTGSGQTKGVGTVWVPR